MLEDAGYEVVDAVPDAATAIYGFGRLRPDIVLLGFGLPDRDGFSVAQALSAEESPPVVVLISGRDAGEYGVRVQSCGARGFLAKAELTAESLATLLGNAARS